MIREARARVGMEGGFCGWLVGVLGVKEGERRRVWRLGWGRWSG